MNKQIFEERLIEANRHTRVNEEIRSGVRSPDVCDKCGRPVDPSNNVARLDFLCGYLMAFMAIPRHFLPFEENGVVVCEGSPSRAQYIEGQPRDKRASYPYKQELESSIREAYSQMLLESAMSQN